MNIKEKLQTSPAITPKKTAIKIQKPAITQAVGHIKLLPLQGARRADMNTQGECPGLGASAPSGREGNGRDA